LTLKNGGTSPPERYQKVEEMLPKFQEQQEYEGVRLTEAVMFSGGICMAFFSSFGIFISPKTPFQNDPKFAP